MAKILGTLSDEHQVILKVISAILKECKKPVLDPVFFEQSIDFIKNYADKLHHAKEEDLLFKELAKPGVLTHCNPTEQMLYEHDLGRKFVKGMLAGIEKNNRKKIIENARAYAELLSEHIAKEDDILYPMAEESLDDATKKKLLINFKKADDQKKTERNKYLAFASKLK